VSAPSPISAVIADDEPVARASLRGLISTSPLLTYAGEAADGIDAIALIEQVKPDLLFLDVRMPGASGLEVARRLEQRSAVIFTTAYDEYALTAFELGAIDYLRKPFGEGRFAKAVTRAVKWLEVSSADSPSVGDRLAFSLNVPSPLDQIFVRWRGLIIPVSIASVSRFEADDDYVRIHSGGRSYLLYMKLGELASRLEERRFVRVHRSHIVNLEFVASVSASSSRRVLLHMKDGSRVPASAPGTRLLRSHFRVRG
jgi:two-component system LytT family response regulator